MRKALFLFVLIITVFSSCHREIWNEINQLKESTTALQTALKALENKVYVTSVTNNGDNYIIVFSDGTSVSISNGKDGIDGKDGDTIIESVTVDQQGVTFNLSDGTSFTVPLYSAISIQFDFDGYGVLPNSTMDVSYSVSSRITPVTVEVLSSSDIQAKAVQGTDGLKGTINIKFTSAISDFSKVVVFASNGEKMVMHTLHFEEGGLKVSSANALAFSAEGGIAEVSFMTNMGYDIIIPEEAEWISLEFTKAMSEHQMYLSVKSNSTYDDRIAIVKIKAKGSDLEDSITIRQDAAPGLFLTSEKAFFDCNASVFSLDIMTNEQYNVFIPDTSSWIHILLPTKALTPSSSALQIDRNSDDSCRQAVVSVISESGQSKVCQVTQFGTGSSILKIVHDAASFSFWRISDLEYNEIDGINWGDGTSDFFYKDITHTYDDNELHEITVLSTQDNRIGIADISGIKSIDVSNL